LYKAKNTGISLVATKWLRDSFCLEMEKASQHNFGFVNSPTAIQARDIDKSVPIGMHMNDTGIECMLIVLSRRNCSSRTIICIRTASKKFKATATPAIGITWCSRK